MASGGPSNSRRDASPTVSAVSGILNPESRLEKLYNRLLAIADVPDDQLYDISLNPDIPDDDEERALMTDTEINTYAFKCLCGYRNSEKTYRTLLGHFASDFDGWQGTDWRRLNANLRKALKNTLQERGIYVGGPLGRIDLQLAALNRHIVETKGTVPDWPDDEDKEFNSVHLAYLARRNDKASEMTFQSSNDANSQPLTAPVPPNVAPGTPLTVQQQTVNTPVPDPLFRALDPLQPSSHVTDLPSDRDWPMTVAPLSKTGGKILDPYTTLPPVSYANIPLDNTAKIAFLKTWNSSNTFSGKEYESLDTITRQFMKECRSNKIPPGCFHELFDRALSGQAQTYFFRVIQGKNLTFTEIFAAMKERFDTAAHQETYYNNWQTMTFAQLRSKPENAEKSDYAVLDEMLDKFILCQTALGLDFQAPRALLMAIGTACKGYHAFNNIAFHQQKTLQELVGQLRTALMVASSKSGSKVYYTDRRYGRGNPIPRTGTPAPRSLPRSRPLSSKRCWVCNREGCWSTKHTADERKGTRERFLTLKNNGIETRPYGTFLMDIDGAFSHFLCYWLWPF